MSESPQNDLRHDQQHDTQGGQVKPVITAAAAKRANASVVGMILAMLATLAIVMVIVWLNPQQKAGSYRQPVNVGAISADAAGVAGFTPASPKLPQGWYANYARWNGAGSDGVAYWDVGFVTPANTFIALKQSITANPSWTSSQAQDAPVTGTRTIDGHTWELRDKPEGDRSLILVNGKETFILTGAADFKEFDVLAAATTHTLGGNPSQLSTKGANK